MKIINFDDELAVEILKRGDVLAFPTETVFGLGVRYDKIGSFNKLVSIKRRPPDKPFTLMVGNKKMIYKFADVDKKAKKVIEKFMPGPITVLLKPKKDLYAHVTLNSGKIGVRVPGLENLCNLINKVKVPLLVPSANKSGEPPVHTTEEIIDIFDGEIEATVLGHIEVGSKPSTIVDLSEEGKITLVRQGGLSFDKIKEVYNS